ncbi:hypothetical protein J27TS8_02710 [Robertmurraya siralis]|uniref:Prepilin-type N-terminal cleavage/methylation domain-containing protein n=1 Tax=Robertmurraya siralis TaxID=77777 RepID=A0A919WEE3_9BACI|nr:prepilin-type N-terminal cleavage/methylation domain-containing protein [Robertmurraya siralis]GIN60278.1 hypothetical protein J27TS8_02710 [Robertmurraya siralis]
MKKLIRTENGFTLVEVLVTLVIMAIVSGIIYSVFTTGLKLYQKIGIEAQLRDDADYVATMILNKMYEAPPDYIKKYEQDGAQGIELVRYAAKEVERYIVDHRYNEEGDIEIERRLFIYFKDERFFIETVTDDANENSATIAQISTDSSRFTSIDEQSSEITFSCSNPELSERCPHGIIHLNLIIGEDKERFSNLFKIEPLILESTFGF